MNSPNAFATRTFKRRFKVYEDAGIQGLGAEGRWEAIAGSLRLAPLLREF